jgi:DNA-binding winged helix-turn-helix (wHTH) protein
MLYRFQEYELDDRLYELRRTGVPVDLEQKVFDVHFYLLQHRDRVVPKDELLDKLWPGMVVGEAVLTRCITAARKALGDDGGRQDLIKTQHGRGYRFVAAVTFASPVVKSQQEVVSSQEQESNQQTSLASSVKSLGSNGRSLASSVQSPESKTPITPPNDVQTLDAGRQTPDSFVPRHFRSRKVLLLTAAFLLIVTVLTV